MTGRLADRGRLTEDTADEEKLSAALRELSDEPDHERPSPWQIVRRRETEPLTQITQLVELVFAVKGLTIADIQAAVNAKGEIAGCTRRRADVSDAADAGQR